MNVILLLEIKLGWLSTKKINIVISVIYVRNGMAVTFTGEIQKQHNLLIHENRDNTLTDKEFEELSEEYERQISYGPDTPKRYSWHKKKQEEKEKKEEKEARKMR